MVDPERGEACTHLAHQRTQGTERLRRSLQLLRDQTAAVDTGRHQDLEDGEFDQRLWELELVFRDFHLGCPLKR